MSMLVYGAIVISYPDWSGEIYHVLTISSIMGGAVGVYLLSRILDLGSGAAKVGLELGFLALVALFVGYTMPQKSGKPPFTQYTQGVRPTRDTARRGMSRIKIDPNGRVASKIVELFPKR